MSARVVVQCQIVCCRVRVCVYVSISYKHTDINRDLYMSEHALNVVTFKKLLYNTVSCVWGGGRFVFVCVFSCVLLTTIIVQHAQNRDDRVCVCVTLFGKVCSCVCVFSYLYFDMVSRETTNENNCEYIYIYILYMYRLCTGLNCNIL